MTLYLIGLGLHNQEDITLKGLNAIKQCDIIYLENYTSLLQCTIKDLEELYQKPITLADRTQAEQLDHQIITQAKTQNVAFLVIGDALSATTHIDLINLAIQRNVPYKIIHNASIFTAISQTGLQPYKFGKTTSIPFLDGHPNLETPYHIIKQNQSIGAHTLCLLDIRTHENRFMTITQAIEVLQDIERRLKENLITKDTSAIGCARLGCPDSIIKSGTIEQLKTLNFGPPPHALIIPSKLHFMEQEMLERHN